jgi:hypothetical protein
MIKSKPAPPKKKSQKEREETDRREKKKKRTHPQRDRQSVRSIIPSKLKAPKPARIYNHKKNPLIMNIIPTN